MIITKTKWFNISFDEGKEIDGPINAVSENSNTQSSELIETQLNWNEQKTKFPQMINITDAAFKFFIEFDI